MTQAITQKEYTKRFKKLYNLFSEIYLSFYTWKGLQDKTFEKTFSENPNFWSAVLLALENNWLMGLAKIYEESSYSKKGQVISVYALLPYQIDEVRAGKVRDVLELNVSIIKNITKILRSNQLAHNNAQHLLKPKVILSKFPIKYAKVEQLLLLSSEILSNLNPEQGHGYTYKMLIDVSENDSKDVVKKLQYYSRLQQEHFDKLKRGEIEINDYRFPPRQNSN